MQTVTLIIDKRKELSTKYKKLLENEYSVVFVSSDIISALKFIQEQEPELLYLIVSMRICRIFAEKSEQWHITCAQ